MHAVIDHPMLLRQLRRWGLDPGSPPDAESWAALLQGVQRAYRQADEDRYTLERSLELSSQEMRELYDRLAREETARRVAAESRLESLIGTVPGAVFRYELGAAVRVIFMSEGIESITGYPPGAYLTADSVGIVDSIHPEDYPGLLAATSDAVARGVPYTHEYRMFGRDGEPRWVQLRGAPHVGADGRVFIDGLVLDHREQRAAAEALRSAMEAAEASTRAKSEFLANVSHELRTPLNAVIGFSGLLLEEPLSPHARELTELLRKSGENLLALIGDVLDFSKIEARRLELEVSEFDLEEVLDDCLSGHAPRAAAKGLALETVQSGLPPLVRGDRARLRQVIDNFLGNAVKFTERGRVRLEATGRVTEPGVLRVRIGVHDTGVGVRAEVRDRLFRPFSQADASSTRRFGGTGLGLAISHQLAELMGGEVGFESEPDRGAHFWVEVPLSSSRPAVLPLAGLNVLVVDPDEAEGRTIAARLARWGASTTVTDSIPSAIATLRAARAKGSPVAVAVVTAAAAEGSLGPHLLLGASGVPHAVLLGGLGAPPPAAPDGFTSLPRPARGPALRAALLREAVVDVSAPPPEAHELLSLRVLVAEDNAVNRRVLALQLAQIGVQAWLVENGADAVEALSRQPFDLVLMDCQMPVLDGVAATLEIRAAERLTGRSRVRIVALTANAADRERCQTAGMDGFLAKPVRIEQLRRAVASSPLLSPESIAAAPTPVGSAS